MKKIRVIIRDTVIPTFIFVIPTKVGIQFGLEMDPRLRGDDRVNLENDVELSEDDNLVCEDDTVDFFISV